MNENTHYPPLFIAGRRSERSGICHGILCQHRRRERRTGSGGWENDARRASADCQRTGKIRRVRAEDDPGIPCFPADKTRGLAGGNNTVEGAAPRAEPRRQGPCPCRAGIPSTPLSSNRILYASSDVYSEQGGYGGTAK